AAGAPGRGVFASAGSLYGVEGSFDDMGATATVNGVRYVLGLPGQVLDVDEAVDRRHEGGYLLMLAREHDGASLGLVALRPHLDAETRPVGERLEITTLLPLDEALDAPQLLALAGAVAAPSASPWSGAFPHTDKQFATDGAFNGLWAAADVQGLRYTLGPPEDPIDIGDAVERRAHEGRMLMLSRVKDGWPLGFVTI